MNIKSVKISNILSIEEAYVEFDSSGLVLVTGWDHDSGRANGAGKTAIFNAIAFALYDKVPRKITATEILRRGSKQGYSEVAVQIGEDVYTVRRSRPKGVTFSKNGSVVNMTQAEWESKLRLNYSQYLISAYCSQGTTTRFLSSNDSEKKQFLLQLLNLEEFSSCRAIAENKVKLLREQDNTIAAQLSSIESKVDAYSESFVDENVINHHIQLAKNAIADLTVELLAAQAVPAPDLSKYRKLEDDIAAKKIELAKTRTKREMLHDQYRKLSAKASSPFQGLDRCRSCGTSLDVSSAKAAHAKEMDECLHESVAIKAQIDECDTILVKDKQINELLAKVREKKQDESKEYGIASLRVSEINGKLQLRHQEIKSLDLKLSNNLDLQNKINDLNDKSTKLRSSRASILREIELYETISAMYSPTGAQAYILDSVIESFNERVASYIRVLWSDLSYELQSYKENVRGETSAKFSESLMMNGQAISIGSFSGGEFRALSLCVDIALIEVMERQFGISLSPIVLDEPFDGLDGSGRELVIQLLETIAKDRQVVVIDHASEVKSMFSKVISVQKKNGVSSVSLEF